MQVPKQEHGAQQVAEGTLESGRHLGSPQDGRDDS
jgi:hypothetical protein